MRIIVPIQLVPDLVEELVIAGDGKRLDPDSIRWVISEYDDHAIEQAILLKEKHGAEITIIAPDFEGTDDVLYQAGAKGTDRLVKLSGDFEDNLNTHALAKLVIDWLRASVVAPDLVLTGVQSHNSLDGSLGPQLAAFLGYPFVDCVSQTAVEDGRIAVHKEYPGGLVADMAVGLPAVLGIQAANTPPRYIPISKIRQAMKTCQIESVVVDELNGQGAVDPARLFTPDSSQHAEMLEGNIGQVSEKIVTLLKELSVL
jgi:electron transfer flavoprotein beta subunit